MSGDDSSCQKCDKEGSEKVEGRKVRDSRKCERVESVRQKVGGQ